MKTQKFNPTYAARDCLITCPDCGAEAPLSEDRGHFGCKDCGRQIPADQVEDRLVCRYCACGRLVWHGDAAPWETPLCSECVWEFPELFEDWDAR
jgi:DNA-directed RNA polymerase subunit RPC12/RpoP